MVTAGDNSINAYPVPTVWIRAVFKHKFTYHHARDTKYTSLSLACIWNSWSICTESCGGTRKRNRTCAAVLYDDREACNTPVGMKPCFVVDKDKISRIRGTPIRFFHRAFCLSLCIPVQSAGETKIGTIQLFYDFSWIRRGLVSCQQLSGIQSACTEPYIRTSSDCVRGI